MQNQLIFAYMLNLSTHMWEDESSKPRGWYLDSFYTEKNLTDLAVWDETVEFLASRRYNLVLIDVGDGVKYESHPEISAPDAWDKDLLRKKLAEMRARGLEPIPKLNFSACHDTWLKEYRRMISTPTYYKVCADLIRETCELFDYPRFFHLGLDEEGVELQKNYEILTVRGPALWWHDLYFFFAECEKQGARPWVWSDYVWHNPELFLEKMPKTVLQSNWYYGRLKDYPADSRAYKAIAAYELLDRHGFDQIPTSSTWSTPGNSEQTLAHGKNMLSATHLLGYMTASWHMTTPETRLYLLNDAEQLYLARRKVYPETL